MKKNQVIELLEFHLKDGWKPIKRIVNYDDRTIKDGDKLYETAKVTIVMIKEKEPK